MSDAFEPFRNQVRGLQSKLADEEARRMGALDAALEMGSPEDLAFINARYRHYINDLEREIVRLRQHMPPYAELRDGFICLLPATERIDPREPV